MKSPSLQQLALSDGIGWRQQGSNAMHIVQDLTKVVTNTGSMRFAEKNEQPYSSPLSQATTEC